MFLRNLIFGIEDGLVSTVGLLSGIAMAGVPRPTIFLTGVVLLFVEAFSMSAGSFLSEVSVDEMTSARTAEKKSFAAGAVMFVSYFIAGFIPLFPYMVFETDMAFRYSIVAALAALLALGFWSAKGLRHGIRKTVRMVLVGGAAILVGVLAGQLLTTYAALV